MRKWFGKLGLVAAVAMVALVGSVPAMATDAVVAIPTEMQPGTLANTLMAALGGLFASLIILIVAKWGAQGVFTVVKKIFRVAPRAA